MFNIFKRKNKNPDDPQKIGMLQRIALKKIKNMSPEERNKIAEDMMKPENHGKLMQAMEMMRRSGMISDEQLEEAKKKMGM